MMIITNTTDGKHVGEVVDETQKVIIFKDGESMQIVTRRITDTEVVLANSNYIIQGVVNG